MKRLVYVFLLLIGFTNCSKNKCELPLNYSNIDERPGDNEIIGKYKILGLESDFRIILDKSDFQGSVILEGQAPWCLDESILGLNGKWDIVSNSMKHFGINEFGLMFQFPRQNNLNESIMGLGQFLIKKYNGRICIILPIDQKIDDCYQPLSSYSMGCNFITFEKE